MDPAANRFSQAPIIYNNNNQLAKLCLVSAANVWHYGYNSDRDILHYRKSR